ncbi:MAG: hypothetical protein LBU65_14495 [Planctomycetaceae bacterium]|jgi:IS1 family transposase|nr:hypothetical protein [Planctomycetaceae bacterium]
MGSRWSPKNNTAATFRRLYAQVKHLKDAVFYTDNWNAFGKVLPSERHVVGKSGTVMIERNNGNTRHHLGRSKVVSKSPLMVDLTLRLWNALTMPEVFKQYQQEFMAIFK